MSTSIPDAVTPTGVTADLSLLDTIYDNALAKRNAIAQKLEPIVEALNIDTTQTAPRVTEVQMQLINTYLAILGANESAIGRRVASKLKQVEIEATNKHSAAVAELLSKVTVGAIRIGTATEPPNPDKAGELIEKVFADQGLDPVMETELRTDPKNTDV